jgi:hypothetical protein
MYLSNFMVFKKELYFTPVQLMIWPLLYLLMFFFTPMIQAEESKAASLKVSVTETKWTLWRESDNLSVYYRQFEDTKLIEIKAHALLESSLSGFLLFLQDYPMIPAWLDNAKESYLINQISDTENVFMTLFKGVWPVSEREMLIRSRYWQNPDLSVELFVKDASHEIENLNGAVRIKLVKAHWALSPLGAGKLSIQHTIVADPMGNVPLWIANKVALRSMWKTLQALESQLSLSPWQQMPIPGIKERQD